MQRLVKRERRIGSIVFTAVLNKYRTDPRRVQPRDPQLPAKPDTLCGHNKGRSNNTEIDYVIALDGQIVPIELKSGVTGSLRSLHQFMGEKNLPVAIRFDASVPSSQQIQTTMMKNGESTPVDYRLLIFAIVPSGKASRACADYVAAHCPKMSCTSATGRYSCSSRPRSCDSNH